MQLRRVVVTGLGALTPLGNTLKEYWEGLVSGLSGAAPITRFDATKFKTRFACEVKGFNPEDFIDRKEARKMDPYTQFAVVCADEAIKDSGLVLDKVDRERIGAIWGSGIRWVWMSVNADVKCGWSAWNIDGRPVSIPSPLNAFCDL